MSFFNNDCGDNGCLWVILIVILLVCCCGGRDEKRCCRDRGRCNDCCD